jgi:hypothetical protein
MMAAMPAYPEPSRRTALDIGRCFNDAIDVYRQNFLALFLAAVVFEILSIASLFILAGPMFGGIVIMTLRSMSAGPPRPIRMGDMFGQFHRFWPLVGLFFIEMLAGLAGLALLIVPGIAIAALWLFPTYLMLEHHLGVVDALTTSVRIVRRRGFWINFALAGIMIALSLGPALVPYVGWVVGWLLTPLVWLLNTSAYIQEVQERPEDIGADFPRGFPVVTQVAATPAAPPGPSATPSPA